MRVEESSYFADTLQAATLVPSAGCVSNTHVAAAAEIAASKMEHRFYLSYGQSGNATAVTLPIHVIRGATGTLLTFKAGLIAACTGTAAVTVDLKKNGTTVLTAPISLVAASTVRTLYAGTLTGTSTVADDWYEIVVTASAGDGAVGTGLLVEFTFNEASS